tara:strand:+ start:362 stop:1777 length:1416 start_codon:yes stop_codon:yes gene_type:complete
MNKHFFRIIDYIKNFSENNRFGSILLSIFLFFLFLLYFTIPAYYNYENFDKELKNKVSKDFKLDLKNIKNIKYLILPTPHFLIEECDLFFSSDPKEKLAKLKNLRINVYSKNLYKKEKIELKNIVLKQIDFDLQIKDINNFYNHLRKNITKPILIKNSNFFFRDKDNKIILISKINNIDYFFNLKNKEKNLNILGKLFGSNYSFKWNKNYSYPYISKSNIKFKNPNLNIFNEFDNADLSFVKAKTSLNFLNDNLILNYKFNRNEILFSNNKSQNKSNNSKLSGSVDLNPFYFDLKLDLKKNYNIEDLLNNIFLNLYKSKQSSNLSFNGLFLLNFEKINNRLFKNLILNIRFNEGKINLKDTSLYLRKIGKINFSDPVFIEKNQKLLIKSKVKFEIDDLDQFFKRFQISKKNRIDLEKVFFEVEYNVDDSVYYLSNINFVETKSDELYFQEINNVQQFKNLVSKEFSKINLD